MSNSKKIYIAADHTGLALKKSVSTFLISKGYEVNDIGAYIYKKDDDYPDYAEKVCKLIQSTKYKGILICGTGQGMVRSANAFSKIYATMAWDELSAKVAKEHHNTNVLCLGARVTKPIMANKIIRIWLETKASKAKRHQRRIKKIKIMKKKYANT